MPPSTLVMESRLFAARQLPYFCRKIAKDSINIIWRYTVNVILRGAHNVDNQQHSIISCMAKMAGCRRKTLTISDIKGTDISNAMQLANT